MTTVENVCCPACGAPLSGIEGKTVVICDYCGTESRTTMTTPEAFKNYTATMAQLQPKIDELGKKMDAAIGRGDKKLAVRCFEGQMRLQMRSTQQAVGADSLEEMIVPMVQKFAQSMGVAWTPPSKRGKLGKVEDLRDEQGRLVPPSLEFMSTLRIDPKGNLIVVQSGAILRFSPGGEYLGAIRGDFKALTDAAADAQGCVYALDLEACEVIKFGPDGKFQLKWGRKADLEEYKVQKKMYKGRKFLKPDEFGAPTSIAVDPSGAVLVGDVQAGVIKKFSPVGKLEWERRSKEIPIHLKRGKKVGFIRRLLFGGEDKKWSLKQMFGAVDAMDIDKDGCIIVADNMEEKITILKPSGRYKRSIMRIKTGLIRAEEVGDYIGVAAAPDGTIYVLESRESPRILKLTRKGKLKKKWGSKGPGPGQFGEPEAIAVDPSGNVYVADSGNANIQKFTPDGKFVSAIGKQPAAGAPAAPQYGERNADLDELDEDAL